MADAQAAVGDAKLDVLDIEVISENEPHHMVQRVTPAIMQAGKVVVRTRVKVNCGY